MNSVIKKLQLEAGLVAKRFGRTKRASDSGLVQWAIIGPGYMGEQFARALGRESGMNVRAVFSRSQERADAFARRHGAVGAYSDLGAMLEAERGRVDVVYVATPAGTHYGIAVECLRAGFNVLCEKPLTLDAGQALELYGLAERSGCRLIEGMWFRCLPTSTQAQRWISEGRIGAVRRVEAAIGKDRPGSESSALYDFGAYVVAGALDFVGDAGSASVEVERRDREDGIDCGWTVEGHLGDGRGFGMSISNDAVGDSSLRVIGEVGQIVIPSQFNRANQVILLDADGVALEEASFSYRSDGFEYEIRDVAACVRDGCPTNLSPELSMRSLRFMDALARCPEGESMFQFDF